MGSDPVNRVSVFRGESGSVGWIGLLADLIVRAGLGPALGKRCFIDIGRGLHGSGILRRGVGSSEARQNENERAVIFFHIGLVK